MDFFSENGTHILVGRRVDTVDNGFSSDLRNFQWASVILAGRRVDTVDNGFFSQKMEHIFWSVDW